MSNDVPADVKPVAGVAILRVARPAVRFVIPLIVLAGLWHWLDGAEIAGRLASMDWRFALAAFAAANLQIALSARRWRITAAALGIALGARYCLREYYMAQFVNQTVPGGVVGDAARAARSRHGAGLGKAAQAVIIERAAGQIALFFVLSAGLVAAIASGQLAPASWFSWIALAGAVIVALLGLAAAARRGRLLPLFLRPLVAPIGATLLARAMWPRQVVLGLLIVACNLASFALAARATGTVLSPLAVVSIVPLVLAAMLVPASVGGWGVREGAAAALLPLAGAAPEAAVAASVAFGIVILAASLPGALWLMGAGGTASVRDADAEHPDRDGLDVSPANR